MFSISAKKNSVGPEEAAALYVELGWGTERHYPRKKMAASLQNCDIVVSARNGAGELIGIARALTDKAIDTKILDMIVVPEYQKQGVGFAMMKKLESLCRGTAIYCETERKNFAFAAKCGLARRRGLTVFTKRSGK